MWALLRLSLYPGPQGSFSRANPPFTLSCQRVMPGRRPAGAWSSLPSHTGLGWKQREQVGGKWPPELPLEPGLGIFAGHRKPRPPPPALTHDRSPWVPGRPSAGEGVRLTPTTWKQAPRGHCLLFQRGPCSSGLNRSAREGQAQEGRRHGSVAGQAALHPPGRRAEARPPPHCLRQLRSARLRGS